MAGLLTVWGPGLIVMLANTDAGCLITAAQSGQRPVLRHVRRRPRPRGGPGPGQVDLVSLAVDVEVTNALLLPLVLGFLLALEARALPSEHRMRGWHRAVVTTLCLAVMGFGLFMVPVTLGL